MGIDGVLSIFLNTLDAEEGFESMSFAVTAELIGASRKNYASCLKYATNCRFLPILKKGKAQKSLKLLSFFGCGGGI